MDTDLVWEISIYHHNQEAFSDALSLFWEEEECNNILWILRKIFDEPPSHGGVFITEQNAAILARFSLSPVDLSSELQRFCLSLGIF
jgi:hypothetical protein